MAEKHEDSPLWHLRLGHASKEKMRLINFCLDDNEICDSCNKVIHIRLLFRDSSMKSISCFDLIHNNVWELYKMPSLIGLNTFSLLLMILA